MLIWLTILGYGLGGYFALQAIYRVQTPSRPHIYWPATLAVLVHLSVLASQLIASEFLTFNLLDATSVIIFLIIAALLISGLTKPLYSLFAFAFPIAALVLVMLTILPQPQSPSLNSPGVVAHAFISMLAYSIISLATLNAILLDLQSRQLRKHHLSSRLNRFLPPLQTMERLLFEWLILGFFLLTAAIVSGALYIDNLFTQHLVHKTVLTLMAWLLFAILLIGHFKLGWRSSLASRLTILGFVFLMLAFFGSEFVLGYLLTTNSG